MRVYLLLVAIIAVLADAVVSVQSPAVADDPDRTIPTITVSSPSAGEINAVWGTPSETGTLSSYRVSWALWSENGFTSYKDANSDTGGNAYPTAPASSYTITGLADGEYAVYVRARYGDSQNGPFRRSAKVVVGSEPAEPDEPAETPEPANTPEPAPEPTAAPGAITGLTLTSSRPGHLWVSWDQADPEPTEYRLNWAPVDQPFPAWNSNKGGNLWREGTALDFSNLVEAGVTYKLWMRAIYKTRPDAPWSGPWSEIVTQRVRNHPPAAPADLSVDWATHDGVVLSWSAPEHNGLTGYRILRGSTADALETIVEDTGDLELTHTDTTAADDATHHYAITALSLDGDGSQSGTVSATTPPRTPETPVIEGAPAAPAGLTAQLDGSGGVTLSWTDPDDNAITGYRVLRGDDALSMRVIKENTGSTSAGYTDATAPMNSTHVYAVQARNAVGLSQLSNTVSAASLGAPTDLRLAASSDSRVTLTWTGPDSTAVTGYRILRGPSDDALAELVADTGGTATSHEDGTAAADTTYHYAVSALGPDGEGPSSASTSVTVPPAAENNEPRDPPPPPVFEGTIIEIVDDEEPQISEEQSVVLVDLTTLSNVVVSNINQTGAGSHLLNSGDEVAYRVGAIPNEHENGDGYNITGVKIVLSDFVRGADGVRVRLIQEFKRDDSNSHLDDIEPMSSIGSDPLIGYFSSGFNDSTGVLSLSPGGAMKFNGGAYPHCTVIRPPATPSASDNDCRNLDYSKFINGNGFFVVIEATYGSFSVLHTAGEHDIQVGHDLNADLQWGISSFSYKRAPSGWQELTGTNKPLMLVTAEKISVVAATSPPAAVPARPTAPSNSVSTYGLGRWQSVSLENAGPNNDTVYKVGLTKNTNYRMELRFASNHASATAYNASVRFSQYHIDNASVHSGTGLEYVVNVKLDENGNTVLDSDGNPVFEDTPIRERSTLTFASSKPQGHVENVIHQDFRTPAVLDANGPESCNEDSELDYGDNDCILAYDYPHHYYIETGTGVSHSNGDYGTMQFRITRLGDQTLAGMGRLSESRLVRGYGNPGVLVPSSSTTIPTPAPSPRRDEIEVSGDIDWFNITERGQSCSYSVTGVDMGGATASGLRMRAFDLNFDTTEAPAGRGSYRASLSDILSSDETSNILEITGSRAGGYEITRTCAPVEAEVVEEQTTDTVTGRIISCGSDGLCDKYDDLLDRHRANRRTENAVTDERRLPTSYGRITVGGTARGVIEGESDVDIFTIEVTPKTDYRVRVTSASRRVSLPPEDLVVEVTAAPAVPAVDAVDAVPDDPTTPEDESMPAVPAQPAQPAITGIPGQPALDAWSHTYDGMRQADLDTYVLQGKWATDNKGTPGDTSDDTRTCELYFNTDSYPAAKSQIGVLTEVGPAEITFSSYEHSCLAVAVTSTDGVRSVGGYSLRVTSEGLTFVPGSDDDYTPLVVSDPYLPYDRYITGEWDHDDDESTANRPLSQRFGRLSGGRGSTKINTPTDSDMFKHRLSAGTHGIKVYDAETLDTNCKTSASSSGGSCTSVQSALIDKIDRMMRPEILVLNGIASSSDYTDEIAYDDTTIAKKKFCTGAVNYRAEVTHQSEINIEDNADTPEDESANNRPERPRVPAVAGVRPTCEKPTAWLPLEITEAGDYYLAISTAWRLPRDRWSIRTTGELNIEQFTQNTQPSISSVSVSDITRTSAKFTVVVSNSWVNRVYFKTVNESGSTAYPSKLTSAAGAGQSDTLVFDTTVRSDRPLIAGAIHTVSVSTTSDFSSNVVTRTFTTLP